MQDTTARESVGLVECPPVEHSVVYLFPPTTTVPRRHIERLDGGCPLCDLMGVPPRRLV